MSPFTLDLDPEADAAMPQFALRATHAEGHVLHLELSSPGENFHLRVTGTLVLQGQAVRVRDVQAGAALDAHLGLLSSCQLVPGPSVTWADPGAWMECLRAGQGIVTQAMREVLASPYAPAARLLALIEYLDRHARQQDPFPPSATEQASRLAWEREIAAMPRSVFTVLLRHPNREFRALALARLGRQAEPALAESGGAESSPGPPAFPAAAQDESQLAEQTWALTYLLTRATQRPARLPRQGPDAERLDGWAAARPDEALVASVLGVLPSDLATDLLGLLRVQDPEGPVVRALRAPATRHLALARNPHTGPAVLRALLAAAMSWLTSTDLGVEDDGLALVRAVLDRGVEATELWIEQWARHTPGARLGGLLLAHPTTSSTRRLRQALADAWLQPTADVPARHLAEALAGLPSEDQVPRFRTWAGRAPGVLRQLLVTPTAGEFLDRLPWSSLSPELVAPLLQHDQREDRLRALSRLGRWRAVLPAPGAQGPPDFPPTGGPLTSASRRV